MDTDILDGILELEDDFYKEGYALGLADGARAGYTEGSVFAVENAFDKLLQLGRLYGKALVWNQRLASSAARHNATSSADDGVDGKTGSTEETTEKGAIDDDVGIDIDICQSMPALHEGSRLAKNIHTLLALVDPATLVLENTEDAVSEIEERLRGASLKAKLIQRALGESDSSSQGHGHAVSLSGRQDGQARGDGSGSIEDISSLHVRH